MVVLLFIRLYHLIYLYSQFANWSQLQKLLQYLNAAIIRFFFNSLQENWNLSQLNAKENINNKKSDHTLLPARKPKQIMEDFWVFNGGPIIVTFGRRLEQYISFPYSLSHHILLNPNNTHFLFLSPFSSSNLPMPVKLSPTSDKINQL